MPTLQHGARHFLNLGAGQVLTVTCDAVSSAVVRSYPIAPGGEATGQSAVAASGTYTRGPFMSATRWAVEAAGSGVSYAIAGSADADATVDAGGNVAANGSPVSGAGNIGPATTFANLPSAASSAGLTYRVTDVGPVGAGSLWISDGTRWRTLGGRQLHCAAQGTIAAPLATLSGATGKFSLPAGDRVTSGSILLPVGLPQVGQALQVSCKVRHRGTGGAWNFIARIGSGDASTDPSFAQVTGTATDDQGAWVEQDMETVTATSFISSGYSVPNSAGVGALVLRNSNFNNAAQMYLGFYSSTLNAADFLDLISYRVYLLG